MTAALAQQPVRERPLIFSAPMVRAILEGRKAQTRRVVRSEPREDGPQLVRLPGTGTAIYLDFEIPGLGWRPHGGSATVPWPAERIGEACPYGRRGEKLWVRETWAALGKRGPVVYRADTAAGERVRVDAPWRPSIHMPRWACRITLEITDVRVQRLQDISEEDARAEGVTLPAVRRICPCETGVDSPGPHVSTCAWRSLSMEPSGHRYRDEFALLWESIHGAGAWERNDWVWVLNFRRVTP